LKKVRHSAPNPGWTIVTVSHSYLADDVDKLIQTAPPPLDEKASHDVNALHVPALEMLSVCFPSKNDEGR
jgi:hypothetical protein